ncbi:MAG TPA: DNA polymerase, partial [Methanofollis liminatans]|nr:DNA polymerase [Methanofollis liminatans]
MSDAQATLFSGEAGGLRIGINQVEYTVTGTGAVVHIFGREPSGRAVHLQVTGFRPYFYAPADEVDGRPLPPQVTGVDEAVFTSIKGERLRRLYTVRPTDVRDIRDRYHHHEADIPFATRYMIDAGLTGGAEVPAETVDHTEVLPAEVDAPARLCFIDIECEDLRGFPDPARERIICITCWDSFDDEYTTLLLASAGTSPDFSDEWTTKNGCLWKGKSRHVVCTYETEEVLMRAFAAYIREKDPDILSGWNFTDFDLPYITRRMEVLGLNPSDLSRLPGMTERTPVRGRAVFDLLTAYKKLQPSQKESYRLDAVAEDEIGERKVRYAGTISDLWLEDPERLVEYNTTDVELCVRINAKNSIVDFYRMISRYVGVPLD